jgi:TonB family protein
MGAIQMTAGDRFLACSLGRVRHSLNPANVRGAVLLSGVVTPEGNIINIRVLRSLDRVIDERAVDAFRQYKFSPAQLNAKPVFATYREELTFAAPPPSILEIEEEKRKQRELEKEREKEREKQRRKKP